MTHLPGGVPLRLLLQMLPAETRRAVVRRVLEFLPGASPEARRELEDAIRGRLRISGGFRDPLLAPRARLAATLADVCGRSSPVAAAVLRVWIEASGVLADAARDFLASRQIPVVQLGEGRLGVGGAWQPEEALQAATDFCALHPDYGQQEGLLMLCCLSGRAPVRIAVPVGAGSGEEEAREGSAMAEDSRAAPSGAKGEPGVPIQWQQWVEALRSLPPEAPEWDQLDTFLQAVRELADGRRREREARRHMLREALERLRREHGDALIYFEFSAIAQCRAEAFPPAKVAEMTAELDHLGALLTQYAEARSRPGKTLAEDRARRDALESEIFRVHSTLAAALVAEPPPPGPPGAGVTPEVPPTGPGGAEPPPGGTAPPAGDGETQQEGGPSAEGAARPEGEREGPAEGEGAREEAEAQGPSAKVEPEAAEGRDSEPGAGIWRLLAAEDLPGAYWLARSLEAGQASPPVPSWVLAAVQGSRWVSPENDAFVGDLLKIVSDNQPGAGPAAELLSLAAALPTCLLHPASGLLGWLRTPSCCAPLHSLVEGVRTFANFGYPLRPEDLLGVAGAEQRAAAIAAIVGEARAWLAAPSPGRTQMARATDVLRHMARNDLRELLDIVAADDRQGLSRIEALLEPLEDRDALLDRIRSVDQELTGRRYREIVGGPRDQILRTVAEACAIARRWREAVEREATIQERGSWLFDRMAELREAVRAGLPSATRAVAELASEEQPPHVAAPAQCLRHSLAGLARLLGLHGESGQAGRVPASGWDRLTRGADSLEAALARRLLWLPELNLDDGGLPTPEGLLKVAPALQAQGGRRPAGDALDGWMQRQDYRFARTLISLMDDEAQKQDAERRLEEALEFSRRGLRAAVQRATAAIEQAVLDGIIADDRAEFASVVAVGTEDTLNFASRLATLAAEEQKLARARRDHLEDQRQQWARLRAELAHSAVPVDRQEALRSRVQDALEREDTRLLDELLAHLPGVVEGTAEAPSSWFTVPQERDHLNSFLRALPALEEMISGGLRRILDMLRRRERLPLSGFPEHLPRERREEAVRALEAWLELKGTSRPSREMAGHIATLLAYLGFTLRPDLVAMESHGGDWAHVRPRMSDGGLSQMPQFGSMARGQYDVVCVWERPGVETIASWVREQRLDTQAVLLIYLARLAQPQRRSLTRMTRQAGMSLAVLDEALLVYLAGERDARLPVFMACALPFAPVIPYTPFQAGEVPREMFFGRRAMVNELLRPEGSCLVYGGRQLGKSALLREAQRQFHNPDRQHYACVVDIKLVGDPRAGQGPEVVWRRMRDGLKEVGALARNVTTDQPREIERHIRESLRASPSRRVLVMFDEADNFLDADARENFPAVTAMRDLMTSTQRRLKAIFTGLHNVQRFQGIPNQPLAHFGIPLCVGPLEPDAAHDLVRKPLELLGYRFENSGTILHVLSYTNYHPGLIQLFCHSVLKRLHGRTEADGPPYYVRQGDIEAIYRDPQVRQGIRERFDWTLALDARYQAVAWSLIEDQMRERDGYAGAYGPGEILALVRYWWQAGFGQMTSDELRGLLDEMAGLGVLVRNREGQYRLRSPNLVRLMGSEADIENRLLELSQKVPQAVFDADSHHVPLDAVGSHYSPLTHAQERRLAPPQFGVALVFASRALGLEYLPNAFQCLVSGDPASPPLSACAEIPRSVVAQEHVEWWLRKFLEAQANRERLVAFQMVDASAAGLVDRIEGALRFCAQHGRARNRWLRAIFVFDPAAAWRWFVTLAGQREPLEDRVDAVVTPARWGLLGLRQRLEQQQKLHSDEAIGDILKATSGWPFLVDELLRRLEGADDPRPVAAMMEQELSDPAGGLGRRFWGSLGVEGLEVPSRLLRGLNEMGPIGEADLEVVPEFIGGEPPLTAAQCRAAAVFLHRLGCLERREDGTLGVERVVGRVLPRA